MHLLAFGKENFPAELCSMCSGSGENKALATAGSKETLPSGVELTPTHGQVHIPMSTEAAEMCLHAAPTVEQSCF